MCSGPERDGEWDAPPSFLPSFQDLSDPAALALFNLANSVPQSEGGFTTSCLHVSACSRSEMRPLIRVRLSCVMLEIRCCGVLRLALPLAPSRAPSAFAAVESSPRSQARGNLQGMMAMYA